MGFARQMYLIVAMMSVCALLDAGCGRQQQAKAEAVPVVPLINPPEVTSESKEGFQDLVFYVKDYKRLPDGTQIVRGSGTYKRRPLGLEVAFAPTWQAGSIGKDIALATYRGVVTYRSIGRESDSLLQVLDELYGTKVLPAAMGAETRFTAVSLGGDPRDLDKGPVKLKLSFESANQEDYAELYTNVALVSRRLEFREKDEIYRPQLIRALQRH